MEMVFITIPIIPKELLWKKKFWIVSPFFAFDLVNGVASPNGNILTLNSYFPTPNKMCIYWYKTILANIELIQWKY